MKQKLKGILGIVIMFIALVATYLWITYGQPELESVSLLVAQKDIPKGTVIENANLYFKSQKISLSSSVIGAIKPEQINSLNGKITDQFISSNGQIVLQSFSENSLLLKENQFVFKLPPSWVYSIPSSIRRGDKISIYEIDGKIDSNLNLAQSLELVLTKGKTESIFDTTVVYVKDSTNREVVDTNGDERLDGTSQVSSIEIICAREDTQVLENSVLSGKKLIVVYR
ncbi:MAG TPA: hypothetical protein VIK78_06750 [Ruminiclostridium sp.]